MSITVKSVKELLGASTYAVHELCNSTAIKVFSKYKPFQHTSASFSSETERQSAEATAGYGISIPVATARAGVKTSSWSYKRPGISYPNRLGDFISYYHGAPDNIFCIGCEDGNTIYFDSINPASSTTVFFYALTASGWYANRAKDMSNGGFSSSQGAYTIASCMTTDDITGFNGSTFCIIAYDPDGNLYDHDFTASASWSTSYTEQTNNCQRIALSNLVAFTTAGTWTIYGCARYTIGSNYRYIPCCDFGSGYRKLSVVVADGSSYPFANGGVATSSSGTPKSVLTTDSWDVYVFVTITNGGGRTWYLNPLLLTATMENSGSVVYLGTTTTVSGTRTARAATSTTITVASGKSASVPFLFQKVFASNATEAAKILESGTVTVDVTALSYNGSSLTKSGKSLKSTITYG